MKFFLFVLAILNICQPRVSAGRHDVAQKKQKPQRPPVLEKRPPAYNPEYMAQQSPCDTQIPLKPAPPKPVSNHIGQTPPQMLKPSFPEVNSADYCYPIPSGQQLPGTLGLIPPLNKRRHLVWCTCSTCRDVVPILLSGDKTKEVGFGNPENPNEEDKFPFSKRIKKCNRPMVKIELCNHTPPRRTVRKILMLFF